MSWFRTRRSFLASATAFALAGCGFRPVYGPNGLRGLQGAIKIETPATAAGFRMQGRLEERLGPAQTPQYVLRVALGDKEDAIAITTEQQTTRYRVTGRAVFDLRRIDDDSLVLTDDLASTVSYSATGTPVAVRSAEDDARDRLAIALADQIVTRVYAGLA